MKHCYFSVVYEHEMWASPIITVATYFDRLTSKYSQSKSLKVYFSSSESVHVKQLNGRLQSKSTLL